ncbi:MAG TPA: hypothetical protein VML01_13730, partial [Bryobacterales bacterium]|nr:hypothetical protein [Bryobacterales bacterium]
AAPPREDPGKQAGGAGAHDHDGMGLGSVHDVTRDPSGMVEDPSAKPLSPSDPQLSGSERTP